MKLHKVKGHASSLMFDRVKDYGINTKPDPQKLSFIPFPFASCCAPYHLLHIICLIFKSSVMLYALVPVPRDRYLSMFQFLACRHFCYSYGSSRSIIHVYRLPSGFYLHHVVRSGRLWFSQLPF